MTTIIVSILFKLNPHTKGQQKNGLNENSVKGGCHKHFHEADAYTCKHDVMV